eukprot:COSAG01_NODE_31150_length_602_cov_39.180915_1_plen_49_part_10
MERVGIICKSPLGCHTSATSGRGEKEGKGATATDRARRGAKTPGQHTGD